MKVKIRQWFVWLLIIVSIASLAFAPFDELKESVIDNAPWVLGGVLLSEALFIIGLMLVATAVGANIGNPLTLKSRVGELLRVSTANPLFWIGFWVNAVGAAGDGIILGFGVIATLPATSWGLAVLPFLDLGATIALRALVLNAVRADDHTGGGE